MKMRTPAPCVSLIFIWKIMYAKETLPLFSIAITTVGKIPVRNAIVTTY